MQFYLRFLIYLNSFVICLPNLLFPVFILIVNAFIYPWLLIDLFLLKFLYNCQHLIDWIRDFQFHFRKVTLAHLSRVNSILTQSLNTFPVCNRLSISFFTIFLKLPIYNKWFVFFVSILYQYTVHSLVMRISLIFLSVPRTKDSSTVFATYSRHMYRSACPTHQKLNSHFLRLLVM